MASLIIGQSTKQDVKNTKISTSVGIKIIDTAYAMAPEKIIMKII